VEGEERIVRSEVTGRVLDILFAEGATVPAGAVIARLDDADIQARLAAKRQEVAVLEADIQTQEERVDLVQSTWARDLKLRQAELRQAESTAQAAERPPVREQERGKTEPRTAQR